METENKADPFDGNQGGQTLARLHLLHSDFPGNWAGQGGGCRSTVRCPPTAGPLPLWGRATGGRRGQHSRPGAAGGVLSADSN